MSLHRWLQNLRSALTPGRSQRHPPRRGLPRAVTHRPHLEVLEDRLTPSFVGPFEMSVPRGSPVAWAWDPYAIVADFTSDGILDQMSSTVNEVLVRPGRGDGTFGDPIRTAIPTLWGFPWLAAADFNNDGALDVFTFENDYHDDWSQANVLLGGGNGQFGARLQPVERIAARQGDRGEQGQQGDAPGHDRSLAPLDPGSKRPRRAPPASLAARLRAGL